MDDERPALEPGTPFVSSVYRDGDTFTVRIFGVPRAALVELGTALLKAARVRAPLITEAADDLLPGKSIGARIHIRRKELKITQDGLAQALGVTRSAVAQWETDRASPTAANLTAIARTLQVKLQQLMEQ